MPKADYLVRPANHRETILLLPDLTQADIDAVHDRFTELRVRRERARWGGVPLLDHAYVVARSG